MNVIDIIIRDRQKILSLVNKHSVVSLKLYGSVLARTETPQSDIDFLAFFDSNMDYHWETRFKVQKELEQFFNKRVGVLDARKIPDVFRQTLDQEPVDILELSSEKLYTIKPKTSKLYYEMLYRMFNEFNFNYSKDVSDSLYMLLAEQLSWWFGRLLRLSDNDLKTCADFNFVEVLYLCDKVSSITQWDYTNKEMERFKELLETVKNYVQLMVNQLCDEC